VAELVLVLGGVRAGKTSVAETLLHRAEVDGQARGVVYVGTAVRGVDPELDVRVDAHRARRPAHWQTVEGADPAAAVAAAPPGAGVLVDGLGMWLAGRMEAAGAGQTGEDWAAAAGTALVAAAKERAGGPVVVVNEEAGMGVIPFGAMTRAWLDLNGVLNRQVSASADRAFLVVAGRAIPLPDPMIPPRSGSAP
jgi:adenosyl cobinamide kinase/adenosyl cobinamide phosphate guanylyltransferase